MRLPCTYFLLFALLAATTNSFILKKTDSPSTAKQFLNDVKTAAHDLKESTLLKKKAVIGGVAAVGKAKLGVLKTIKDTKVHVLKTIVDMKLAKLEAAKAAKLSFLKTLINKFASSGSADRIHESAQQFLSHPLVKPHHEQFSSHFPLLSLITDTFSRKGDPPKDYIKIGNTDYVFVPSVPRPSEDSEKHEDGDAVVIENSEEKVSDSSEFSTAKPAHSLISTLPSSYGPPSSYETV